MNNQDHQQASADYRRKAIDLLQNINIDESIARSIGRSIIASNASECGNCRIDDDPITSLKTSDGQSIKQQTMSSLYTVNGINLCTGCGQMLLPGENGCTVRIKPLKRSRTMRRRASREKKARFIRAARLKQKGVAIGDKMTLKIHPIDCANVVVYTCGYCGTKDIFAGSPVKNSVSKKALGQKNYHASRSKSLSPFKDGKQFSFSGSKKWLPNTDSKPLDRISKNSTHSVSDFIALPDASTHMNKSIKQLSTPVLSRKRNRRKSTNQKDAKKNKLMNFLSSLND